MFFTRFNRYRDRSNGFTLVELIIVVLIVGILAAIAIPVYLGIQNQAHRAAIKGDVNQRVKQVQVALTGGATASAQYNTYPGSDQGSTVTVQASTTTGAGNNDFMVIGNETRSSGAIDYTYQYDSVTGQFTDSDSGVAFGGGTQNPTAPTLTVGTVPAANLGSDFNLQLTATGYPRPTFSATGMPAWLSLNVNTGLITGRPTAAGSVSFTVKATNNIGTDTQPVTFTVTSTTSAPTVPATATAPNGVSGVVYTGYTLRTSGYPYPTISTPSSGTGKLPTGLAFSTTGNGTFTLSGTPTVSADTAYTIPVTVTNSQGSATQNFSFTVYYPPQVTATLAGGQVSAAYSGTITATGDPDVALNVNQSTLPPGLALTYNTAGTVATITGTPTTPGTYSVSTTATNPTDGTSTTKVYGIVIWAVQAQNSVTYDFTSNPNPFDGGQVGSGYLYLSSNSSGYASGTVYPEGMNVALTKGRTYTLSYKYRSASTYTTAVNVSAGGFNAGTSFNTGSNDGVWRTVSQTFTVTGATTQYYITASFNGYSGGCSNAPCTGAQFDDITLTRN